MRFRRITKGEGMPLWKNLAGPALPVRLLASARSAYEKPVEKGGGRVGELQNKSRRDCAAAAFVNSRDTNEDRGLSKIYGRSVALRYPGHYRIVKLAGMRAAQPGVCAASAARRDAFQPVWGLPVRTTL